MRIRQRLTRFNVGAIFLTGLALTSIAAKCIENTSVYVDDEGYTHVAGEMYNETDIQGTRIMLRGTLFDAAGNVIATKDAPTCPPDTQANSQIIFDIRFDNPGVPPHARYEVRAISGITLEAPLPKPDVVIQSTDAIQFIGYPFIPEFPVEDTDVFFRYDIRNRSDQAFTGLQGCAAAYNNQGKVVRAEYGEIIELDASGNPIPATLDNQFLSTVFMRMSSVPESAVLVRGWIWFGAKDAPTSQYQFFSTPKITIQTDTFP